jgi:hypothetical protein
MVHTPSPVTAAATAVTLANACLITASSLRTRVGHDSYARDALPKGAVYLDEQHLR